MLVVEYFMQDLTAIGITQPAIRKKLTAEISRLHTFLHDGIPNYRPVCAAFFLCFWADVGEL